MPHKCRPPRASRPGHPAAHLLSGTLGVQELVIPLTVAPLCSSKGNRAIEGKSQAKGLWTARAIRDQGKEAKMDSDTPSGQQRCPC